MGSSMVRSHGLKPKAEQGCRTPVFCLAALDRGFKPVAVEGAVSHGDLLIASPKANIVLCTSARVSCRLS